MSSSLSAHRDLLPVTAALLARPLTPSLPRPLHVVSQHPLDERQPFQPGAAITSQGRSHPSWLCGRGPSPRASTGTSEAPWGLLFPSSSTFARLCRGLPFPTGLSSSEGRGTMWKLPSPWAHRPPGFAGEKLERRLRRGPDASRWDSTRRERSSRCPRRGAGWLRSVMAGSPTPYAAAPQTRSQAQGSVGGAGGRKQHRRDSGSTGDRSGWLHTRGFWTPSGFGTVLGRCGLHGPALTQHRPCFDFLVKINSRPGFFSNRG